MNVYIQHENKHNILVKLFLLCSHVYTKDLFYLGRQWFLYILFDTSQKEGLEDFVKTLITIFPTFPMFILKIFPGVKPVVRITCHSLGLFFFFSPPTQVNIKHNVCNSTITHLSGMRKCNKDQSSLREFCSGVPVISSLWLDLNSIKVLYSRLSSFFSLWASSTPRKAQLMLPSTLCKMLSHN